jgi:hypothetical protein
VATLKNITIDDTGAFVFPNGTTAQRPTPTTGMIRYNTDIAAPEFYTGVVWTPLIPTGAIELFATSTVPNGWLKANGASISTTTYAALFAKIGYTWGGSGGSFNVPDLRGEFIRSWDDGRGVNSGRGFASFQDQDWKGYYATNTGSNTTGYSHGPVYMGKTIFGTFTGNLFGGRWQAPAAGQGYAWDSGVIRPRNRAVMACIKY